MESGDRVKFLDPLARVVDNYIIHDPKPNRSGLIALKDINTGCVIKVNKKRVRPSEESGSVVTKIDNEYIAACPESGNIVSSQDGKFSFDIVNRQQDNKKQVNQNTNNHEDTEVDNQNTINYDELAEYGDLWVKYDTKFNGTTDLKTCRLILTKVKRHLAFNTYNDTYGKKGTMPPIQDALNGKNVGYILNDKDKLEKKLIKKGYVKYHRSEL